MIGQEAVAGLWSAPGTFSLIPGQQNQSIQNPPSKSSILKSPSERFDAGTTMIRRRGIEPEATACGGSNQGSSTRNGEETMTGKNVRLLMLTSALSLCSDFGAPAFAGPPTVDPCSLLTNLEVEQIVGRLAGKPKPESEGAAAWCNYEFANGKDAMEVWVFPADGIERGRKQAKKAQPLKGLGDDAFMDRGAQGLDYVNLFIKKGTVTVEFSLKETAGDEEKLKTLARKALNRF